MDAVKHECPLSNIVTALSLAKYKACFNVQNIKTFLVAPRVDKRRGDYMDNIYMYAGEKRTVHVMVTGDPGVEFEITDPKYSIIYQDEIIDEGLVWGSKEPEPEEPGEGEPPVTEPEEGEEPGGAETEVSGDAATQPLANEGPTEEEDDKPVEPGPEPEPEPEHDPHELIITMNPKEPGKYILTVDFWVAGEHIIRQHNIYVRKTK